MKTAIVNQKKILIDAENIRGLGSLNVCTDLVPELLKEARKQGFFIVFKVSSNLWDRIQDNISDKSNLDVTVIGTSKIEKVLSLLRYFLDFYKNKVQKVIVLGDLPLFTKTDQTVFLQQANLINPSIEPHVNKGIKFKIMRWIFRRNFKNVNHLFVQTDFMKSSISRSYSHPEEKIAKIGHTFNKGKATRQIRKVNADEPFIFYYPASFYPHKNHKALWPLISLLEIEGLQCRFDLTISADQAPIEIQNSKYVKFLGVLSPDQCEAYYSKVDALFFPSLLESYGLPLIEAMHIYKLIVLAADRPFAREICGDKAVFFESDSTTDLLKKVKYCIENRLKISTNCSNNMESSLVSWEKMALLLLS